MKKLIFSALCALGFLSASTNSYAQDVFVKDSQYVNIGIGLPRSLDNVGIPPISAFYERSIIDGLFDNGAVGVGAIGELYTHSGSGISGWGMFLGPRASFHYQFLDRLDTYIGLQAGVYYHKYQSVSHTEFDMDAYLGARYLFTNSLGAFAELGSGFSTLKVGVTLQF